MSTIAATVSSVTRKKKKEMKQAVLRSDLYLTIKTALDDLSVNT